MTFIINLIVFIFVLGIIILIHEGGHFFFAKRAGILCHEFSIGMGPALYQKRDGETVYSIRAIPIGGYVSMAGEAVSDAMFKKEQTIGLNFDKSENVKEIVLDDRLEYQVIGVVKSFDLYGKDGAQLFIELETEEGVQKYNVLRNAKYLLNKKSEMFITPEEKSFESKSLWKRFLTIFGGPLMNFILAFVLFFAAGFFVLQPNYESNAIGDISSNSAASSLQLEQGDEIVSINGESIESWYNVSVVMSNLSSAKVDLVINRNGTLLTYNDVLIATYIQSAGITNTDGEGIFYYDQAIIGDASGRAAEAGLEAGDIITAIDTTPVTNWDDVIAYFETHTDSYQVTITYERDGVSDSVTYQTLSASDLNSLGTSNLVFQIGVSASGAFNLGYSLLYAPRQFASNVADVFNTIALLFGSGDSGLGVSDLSGPIGIFTLVSSVRENGFLSLVVFMGFLSINIGILNLLPIPALDGGRLVFLGIEAVTRKPVNKKIENTANLVMFFALMALIIYVSFNDVIKLI